MTTGLIPRAAGDIRPADPAPSRLADVIVLVGATLWIAALLLPSTSWTTSGGPRISGPSVMFALLGAPAPDGALPSTVLLWGSTIFAVLALASWLTGHPRVAVALGVPGALLARAWAIDLGSLPAPTNGPLGWYRDVRVEAAAWLLPIGVGMISVGFLVAESASAAGRLAPARTESRVSTAAAYAIAGGIVLWAVAQLLPAYTTPEVFGDGSDTTIGLGATLGAWCLALLGGSLAIGMAWTTNIWFVFALVARWRHHQRVALIFALAAAGGAVVGMWVLLSGGLSDNGWGSAATVTSVDIGSWLWLGGVVLVLGGIAAWAFAESTSADAGATGAPSGRPTPA